MRFRRGGLRGERAAPLAAEVDNGQGQRQRLQRGAEVHRRADAPALATPLLGAVSHLPAGDWRIGAPFYFCAVLQLGSLLLAVQHFRKVRRRGAASS